MSATIKEEKAAYQAELEAEGKVKLHGHPEMRGGAFAIMPKIFLRSTDFSSDAKVLYGILLTFVGENTECWPGQARLCVHLGVSEPTLRKVIKELTDAGLVRVRKGGDGQTSHYEVDKYEGYVKSRPKENSTSEISDRKNFAPQNERILRRRTKEFLPNIETGEINTEDIKKESAVLSMEDDANAQDVASFSSHSDLVSDQETEDTQNTQDHSEPSKGRAEGEAKNEKPTAQTNIGNVPRGRASVTPDLREKMKSLAAHFYLLHPKANLNLNAEITKYHGELADFVKREVTFGELDHAVRSAQARFAPPLQVTIKSVHGNWDALMKPDTYAAFQTLSTATLAPRDSTVAPDPGFAAFMAKIKK